MFSDLAGIREALRTRLKPALPNGWRVQPYVTGPDQASLLPGLYFEFNGFSTTANGQNLPTGQASASVALLIVTRYTDTEKGEDEIDDLALKLIGVLDQQSDLFWADAEKERLPSGQLFWRIHTTALTNT